MFTFCLFHPPFGSFLCGFCAFRTEASGKLTGFSAAASTFFDLPFTFTRPPFSSRRRVSYFFLYVYRRHKKINTFTLFPLSFSVEQFPFLLPLFPFYWFPLTFSERAMVLLLDLNAFSVNPFPFSWLLATFSERTVALLRDLDTFSENHSTFLGLPFAFYPEVFRSRVDYVTLQ